MPFFLRKVRQSKWYKNSNVDWLAENDQQADALVDFASSGNKLSVWQIGTDEDLERTISAYSAGLESISNFDYAHIDPDTLSNLNIKLKRSQGSSSDSYINDYLHYDMIELTRAALCELIAHIHANDLTVRIGWKEVGRMIQSSINGGNLDRSDVDPNVLNGVRKAGYPV